MIMLMEYELAKKARQVGVPGMTRLYSGYHTVKGTYDDCMEWFRDEGMFIGVELGKNASYTCKATFIQTGQVVHEENNTDYHESIHKVVKKLIDELPIDKKVRMS